MSEIRGMSSLTYFGTQSVFVPGILIFNNILIAHEMFHGLKINKSYQDKFMVIHADMSKTYDRVEWIFIQEILFKMRFDHHCIQLMMKCISSVKYIVLSNCQPKRHRTPEREGSTKEKSFISLFIYLLCVRKYW